MNYVWVTESGEYEQRSVRGIYSSLDKAIAGIKAIFSSPPDPEKVTWRELGIENEWNTTLKGRHQNGSKIEYDITKWEIDE